MELENAMEEELKKGCVWVPVTPAKQSSSSINNGVGSHLGSEKNPQFSQNLQNRQVIASEKETYRADREFWDLNSVYCGSDHENFDCEEPDGAANFSNFLVSGHPKSSHDFVGLHETSVEATPDSIIGEEPSSARAYNGLYQEKIKVGLGSEPHKENAQSAFRMDSTVMSTPQEGRSSKRRSNNGIDVNKKPRKRQRMKKHRPKIWDESKPRNTPKSKIEPLTPKPKTPRRTTRTSSPHQKYERKVSHKIDISVCTNGKATRNSRRDEKTCRKALRFNLENHVINQKVVEEAANSTEEEQDNNETEDEVKFLKFSVQNLNSFSPSSRFLTGGNDIPKGIKNIRSSASLCRFDLNLNLEPQDFDSCPELGNIVHGYKGEEKMLDKSAYEGELNKCREMKNEKDINSNLQSCHRIDPLYVYERMFKLNQCLKNSRIIGPNCPGIYKKTRMRRRKATTFDGFWNGSTVDQCVRMVNQKRRKEVALSYGAHGRIYRTGKQRLSWRLTHKSTLKKVKSTKLYQNTAISMWNFAIQQKHQDMILHTRKLKTRAKKDPESFKCMLSLCQSWACGRKRSKILSERQKTVSSVAGWDIADQNRAVIVHPGFHRCGPSIPSLLKSKRKRYSTFSECNLLSWYEDLQNSNESGQLVGQDKISRSEIIPFKGKFDTLKRLNPPPPKVDLDQETIRLWNRLMLNDANEIPEDVEKDNKYWGERRERMRAKVDCFIAIMHLIQGDRRFSPWKGSVVDSVIGVFLTQNVTDHSSSSAFMSLAARFPVLKHCDSEENTVCDQHSVVSYIREPGVLVNKEQPSVYLTKEDMSYHIVENGGNYICSTGKAVPGSMKDEIIVKDPLQGFPDASSDQNLANISTFCATDKSTSYRELLQLEEIDFLKQYSGHQEGKWLSRESSGELQSVKDTSSLETSGLNGTCASQFGAPLAQFDYHLDSIHHKGDARNGRFEDSNDINNLDYGNYFESEIVIWESDTQRIQETIIAEISPSSKFHEVIMKKKNSLCGSKGQEVINPNDYQRGNNVINYLNGDNTSSLSESKRGRKKGKVEPENPIDWDDLRKTYCDGKSRKTTHPIDCADWDAVRKASVEEIADVIMGRGMNNMLAARIKDFLNRLVNDHGSIDLEWLRSIPPDKAREYLLSITGLGLKSVECVRLLTLHHVAFPVDTNVGRIVVRLGWVPLQPLPEDIQIHLLNTYPLIDAIQKYLWPRLCTLDQQTLYELHYQMITFGKVFCTKKKPNCNACPMRGECRHFASAFASARLRLPTPQQKGIIIPDAPVPAGQEPWMCTSPKLLPMSGGDCSKVRYEYHNYEPIIEVPASPEPISRESPVRDIEDFGYKLEDEIPTIRLNTEELKENILNFMEKTSYLCQDSDMSKALVALSPEAASIPRPKLKSVHRLRTVHQVYELPDSHPLLAEFGKREEDDPSPYLLAIWPADETACSLQQSRRIGDGQCTTPCDASTCLSGDTVHGQNKIVRGTILIPCRTANRGAFPLNGTYFQVNEVFADDKTSRHPIDVPRNCIWNLRRRSLYCGTSATSIFRGMSTKEIQHCFWRGFLCVRGVDRVSRAARQLASKFHPRENRRVKCDRRD